MKVLIVLTALVALAAAAPKSSKHVGFRNLYIEATNGKPHPNPRIIGGHEAEPHSIPWQAFIDASTWKQGWYCGASIISEKHILTAAHCLRDEFGSKAGLVTVILGAHRVLDDEEKTQVVIEVGKEALNLNPGFDEKILVNDIGIITLPKALTFNKNIAPVPLPTSADDDYTGATARISGWGMTSRYTYKLSEVLNVLDTEIIANDVCDEQLGGEGVIKSSHICTSGEKSAGFCSGDSGGPLTVDGVQVGIVSFAIADCPAGYPSAYTRVTEFLDWIEQNTA